MKLQLHTSQMRAADLIWNNTANCGVFLLGGGQQIPIKGSMMIADLAGCSLPVRGNADVRMCFCWRNNRQREGEDMRVSGCDRHRSSACKHLPPAAGHGCNISSNQPWRKGLSAFIVQWWIRTGLCCKIRSCEQPTGWKTATFLFVFCAETIVSN